MKNRNFSLLLLLIATTLSAEDYNSIFTTPLNMHPGALNRQFRVDFFQIENKTDKVFELKRTLKVSGEYRFANNFAVTSAAGRTDRTKTDTERQRYFERFQLGLKTAALHRKQTLLTGYYINFHSAQLERAQLENESPEFFLFETGFSLGYAFPELQIITNFIFQTESNLILKERFGQQFRRFYQFEIGVNGNITEKIKIYIESAYREPYSKKIDTHTRSWHLFPGISLDTTYGTFALSIRVPVTGQVMNRGGQLTFYKYF